MHLTPAQKRKREEKIARRAQQRAERALLPPEPPKPPRRPDDAIDLPSGGFVTPDQVNTIWYSESRPDGSLRKHPWDQYVSCLHEVAHAVTAEVLCMDEWLHKEWTIATWGDEDAPIPNIPTDDPGLIPVFEHMRRWAKAGVHYVLHHGPEHPSPHYDMLRTHDGTPFLSFKDDAPRDYGLHFAAKALAGPMSIWLLDDAIVPPQNKVMEWVGGLGLSLGFAPSSRRPDGAPVGYFTGNADIAQALMGLTHAGVFDARSGSYKNLALAVLNYPLQKRVVEVLQQNQGLIEYLAKLALDRGYVTRQDMLDCSTRKEVAA